MNHQLPKALLVDKDVAPHTARQTASDLGLPTITTTPEEGLFLHLTKDYLELVACIKDQGKPLRIHVDFSRGRTRYRTDHLHKEMLIQAVKVQKKLPDTVIDTTGGLGRDAFLLSSAGCLVDICERNIFIAALLKDGLRRAAADPLTADTVSRIKLHTLDAILFLQEQDCSTKVIYMDPMFPSRKKSAKVKQDLRLLQLLEAYSFDEAGLFKAALRSQAKKVIVKRPLKGDFLLGLQPAYSLLGKAIRFDAYLPSSIPSHRIAAL